MESIIEMASSEKRGTTYWSIGTNNQTRKKEEEKKIIYYDRIPPTP